MTSRHQTHVLASLLTILPLALAGCDETVNVPVTVRAGTGAVALEAVALPGPCPSAADLETEAVRSQLGAEPFTAAGVLPIDDDTQSVAAWGLGANCRVIAFACQPLEGTDPIVIVVEPISAYDRCAGRVCGAEGRCSAPMADAGTDLGPPGCGNGRMDEGEACDDGNEIPNDGCESDCTVTCESDADCVMREANVCDGSETCDLDTNTCVSMNPLDCDDGDPCTEDSCDPVMGCVNDPEPFNMDDDGFTAEACGGSDCDDTDDTVFPGAEELCDGIDNDCDGMDDEVAPFWYLDCDGDGFAADTVGAMQTCDEPAPVASCDGWTSLRPASAESIDCNDDRDDVNPSQTVFQTTAISGADYDYDCDGVDETQYPADPSTIVACQGSSGFCIGTRYYVESTVSCGGSATLSTCNSSCDRYTESVTVACR